MFQIQSTQIQFCLYLVTEGGKFSPPSDDIKLRMCCAVVRILSVRGACITYTHCYVRINTIVITHI